VTDLDQMASPHLSALSLDSPLHVSTPAHRQLVTRSRSKNRGHQSHNGKKAVLFQQLLSHSDNDDAEKGLLCESSSSISQAKTASRHVKHNVLISQNVTKVGEESDIKGSSNYLHNDNSENSSSDVSLQIRKPGSCMYS